MSDLDNLLQRVSPSDPQVCQALVETYYGYLLRLALSILGDPQEAEDAAQEACLRALTSLERYRPGGYLKTWLATITINICRDQLRRRQTRQALEAALRAIGLGSRSSPTPEEATLQREQSSRLWQAVQALSARHRLPLLLRYLHEMPVREIAQVLDLKEGTVHSRLHYAVQKLRAHLDEAEDEPGGPKDDQQSGEDRQGELP